MELKFIVTYVSEILAHDFSVFYGLHRGNNE